MSILLRRREFITLLGSAAAWPLAARAQQGNRMRRIGVLISGDENDLVAKTMVSAFTQALADLGWTDGRNGGAVLVGVAVVETPRPRRGIRGQMAVGGIGG
jgi:hypothetical protein